MPDYRLLQSQKNQVFSAISMADLDPRDFELEVHKQVETELVGLGTTTFANRIVHSASGYSFLFGVDLVSYSPGAESPWETQHCINWLGKVSALNDGLSYLKREIEAPDLWEALADERGLLDSEPSTDANSPFSETEQNRIQLGVE